jgi:hypothetical protein
MTGGGGGPGLRIGSYALGSDLTDRRKVLTTRTELRVQFRQIPKVQAQPILHMHPIRCVGRIQVSYCLIQSHFESAAATPAFSPS